MTDEWDLLTATPGKYQACRRMALFLPKHPVLPSQSPLALLVFVGEVSETCDGFLQPEVLGAGASTGLHRRYRPNALLLEIPGLTAYTLPTRFPGGAGKKVF